MEISITKRDNFRLEFIVSIFIVVNFFPKSIFQIFNDEILNTY